MDTLHEILLGCISCVNAGDSIDIGVRTISRKKNLIVSQLKTEV